MQVQGLKLGSWPLIESPKPLYLFFVVVVVIFLEDLIIYLNCLDIDLVLTRPLKTACLKFQLHNQYLLP